MTNEVSGIPRLSGLITSWQGDVIILSSSVIILSSGVIILSNGVINKPSGILFLSDFTIYWQDGIIIL
jgi:hypothetical protein